MIHVQKPAVRGFTLIELMVVVAVVAILAAIAYPSYSNYVLRAKLRVAQGDLVALGAHLENLRQRTLWYPVADAEPSTVVTGWQPAGKAGDFTFHLKSDKGQYAATATWRGQDKLQGCVLTLASTPPARQVGERCQAAGRVDW